MGEYRNRILVVDDDVVMLSFLESILAERYEIVKADHGQTAIDWLSQAQRVDLLILDIRMPEIDGYELMEHIRRFPVCADVPAVFLTSVAGHEEEIRGLKTGVTDYIVKPFRADVLLARVMAVLRAAKRLDMAKLPQTSEKLSDTELSVLQMIALSYSNEDIADRMGYSYGYVRQMISKLLQKLGIENRKDVRNYL